MNFPVFSQLAGKLGFRDGFARGLPPPAGSLQTFGPSRVAAIESVAEPETRPLNPDRPWRLARPNAALGGKNG